MYVSAKAKFRGGFGLSHLAGKFMVWLRTHPDSISVMA